MCIFLAFALVNNFVNAEESNKNSNQSLPQESINLSNTNPLLGDGIDFSFDSKELTLKSEEKDLELGFQIKDFKIFFLKPGSIQIPPRPVYDNQGKQVALTQPIEIKVKGLELSEQEKPENLLGPLALSIPKSWIFSFIFLVCCLVAFIIYRLIVWSQKRKALSLKKFEIPQPVYKIALKRIENLKQSEFWKNNEFKKCAYQISETLKWFIALTFEMDAEEATTSECYQLLLERKGESISKEFNEIFTILDLVKFTDYLSDSNEMNIILEQSKIFILKSKREDLYETR